jgi:hypothetical protein
VVAASVIPFQNKLFPKCRYLRLSRLCKVIHLTESE